MPTRPCMKVRLGPDHHTWYELAKLKGERPATLAADVLRRYLKDALDHNTHPVNEANTSTRNTKAQTSVRIKPTADELALIDEVARRMVLPRSRALQAIMRTAVQAQPCFTLEERKEIRESTKALRAIGNNLNQIARAFNTLAKTPESKTATQDLKNELEHYAELLLNRQLERMIKRHIDAIQELVRASQNRFGRIE